MQEDKNERNERRIEHECRGPGRDAQQKEKRDGEHERGQDGDSSGGTGGGAKWPVGTRDKNTQGNTTDE